MCLEGWRAGQGEVICGEPKHPHRKGERLGTQNLRSNSKVLGEEQGHNNPPGGMADEEGSPLGRESKDPSWLRELGARQRSTGTRLFPLFCPQTQPCYVHCWRGGRSRECEGEREKERSCIHQVIELTEKNGPEIL